MQATSASPGQQHDQLFQAEYNHQEDDNACTNCNQVYAVSRSVRSDSVPGVHYGLIASRHHVIRDGMTERRSHHAITGSTENLQAILDIRVPEEQGN